MDISILLNDKSRKPKENTESLSAWLLNGELNATDMCQFASAAKDPVKATCIEALEFASKQNPAMVNAAVFEFVTQNLTAKAPRVKWESAKVIGNTAHLYKNKLDLSIENLIENTQHQGTVVRWSAAYALGEIIKLKTNHNANLITLAEKICNSDEKNSIKKIYIEAIKKSKI